MNMICLNCQHIGHEDEFIENLGCCPHCNDETVVELEEDYELQDTVQIQGQD